MKYLLTFSLFIILNTSFGQGSSTIDKIVAQVGDNIVLLSDLQGQRIQAIQAQVEIDEQFDCRVLEELMYQFLLLNQAKLDSLEVSDAQVDAEMENRLRVIEAQIGSRQKMEEFYGKTVTQIKKEFKENIRDQLLAQDMERQITSEVSVTPRDVENFYNNIPKDSIPFINSKLQFQQIVIYPEITQADKQLSVDKLTKIREDIVSGKKTFSTMAIIHSMDPGSSKKGGEISASRGMMVPQFEATAFKMEIGQVSEVFETDYGYHILQLLDRKGDDYKCRHILIIPEYSDDAIQMAAVRLDSAYKKLIANKIEWDDAVRLFSNDDATKENNGIITNPITGDQQWDMEDLNQVDQQIYLLTDQLDKGDISQPSLYTNFMERKEGVRIVRLMERTPPHTANLRDDYSLIQKAAENDKKQKIIQSWIASKIKNAYVKIDSDYHSCEFRNNWLKE